MSALNDAQVYARQLLPKRHGYPLWVPEPYGNSVSYRTKGVRIGDVGYVTEDGAFETLFNLRASPTDPINSRGIPEAFEQVHIPFEDIVLIPNFHQPDSTVTSASTKRRAVDLELSTPDIPAVSPGAGTNIQFTWNSSQGAILHLPDGACRLTCPAELFRDVAIRGAKNWYKFANVTLRRGVPNGALYLITGCDKAHSWMVGAFADKSSDTQASFKLSASGFCNARATYSYSWDTSSPAVFRMGPSLPIDSTDTLRRNGALIAQDDALFAGDAPEGRTQCVFIRGYRIMLRTNPVTLMLGGASKIEVNSISSMNPKDIAQAFMDRRYANQVTAADARGFIKRDKGCRDIEASLDAGLFLSEFAAQNDETALEYLPAVLEPYHPSTLINELLLDISPQATVSLIHDDEWGSILCQKDLELLDETTLLCQVLENFWCANGTSSAFLVPRNDQITTFGDSPERLKQYNESIKPLPREGLKMRPGKCGGLCPAAGTEDHSLLQISHLQQENFPGTSSGVLRREHKAESQLSEITNTQARTPRGLPRRVIKPNGRPRTVPNPPTYDKSERPRLLRRQKSLDA